MTSDQQDWEEPKIGPKLPYFPPKQMSHWCFQTQNKHVSHFLKRWWVQTDHLNLRPWQITIEYENNNMNFYLKTESLHLHMSNKLIVASIWSIRWVVHWKFWDIPSPYFIISKIIVVVQIDCHMYWSVIKIPINQWILIEGNLSMDSRLWQIWSQMKSINAFQFWK